MSRRSRNHLYRRVEHIAKAIEMTLRGTTRVKSTCKWIVVIMALSFLVVAPTLLSQQDAPIERSQSEQRARSRAKSAVSAMGGQQHWSGVSDTMLSGECQDNGASNQPEGSELPFRWLTKGPEFRYENSNSEGRVIMLSGHGRPKSLLPTETRQLTNETSRFDRPFYLPALVLEEELQDRAYHFESVGREQVDGGELDHVRVVHFLNHSRDLGSEQEWWFDPATSMPHRIEFKLPGQAVQSGFPVTYTFSQWNSQGNLFYAAQIAIDASDAQLSQTCKVSEVQINTQPADSLFDAR